MRNPSTKQCWKTCMSCYKCENKGKYSFCDSCSGRHDPEGKWDPYDREQYCDCRNGILRHRLQSGKLITKKFMSNPYGGRVLTDAVSQDEQDWNQFIHEKREQLNDENWDPIQFNDGTSVSAWVHEWMKGEKK